MLDLITELKTFLLANGITITAVAFIGTGLLVVLSFALREVTAWLTKNDLNRKELKRLNDRIDRLNDNLNHKIHLLIEAIESTKKESGSSKNTSLSEPIQTEAMKTQVKTKATQEETLQLFKGSPKPSNFEIQ